MGCMKVKVLVASSRVQLSSTYEWNCHSGFLGPGMWDSPGKNTGPRQLCRDRQIINGTEQRANFLKGHLHSHLTIYKVAKSNVMREGKHFQQITLE